MDKWLWAARFFKTRSLAVRACEMNRIQSKGIDAKPARDVKIGDLLQIKNEGGSFEIEVLGLSETRGAAPVAQTLYRETEASRGARAKAIEDRKSMPFLDALIEGKPSKKDRRTLDRLRGRQ